MLFFSLFPNITKIAIWGKMLLSAKLKGMSRNLYIFWIYFKEGVTVTSFIIIGGPFSPLPTSVRIPEKAHPA